MIEFMISQGGELQIVQRDISPTVYLDHWALRRFADNKALGIQLTAALRSQNGTLALSWLNVVEFTKVTVAAQGSTVEELLEANLPQVFFLEVDPFTVIRREDELLAGNPPLAPHADPDLLREVAHLKPTSLKLFTIHDVFSAVQESPLAMSFEDLADSVAARIETLRHELDNNLNFRLAIGRSPSGPWIQRGTRFILREMLRTFLIDRKIKITRNHAIDLLHAVVPVAYCDLVLLDKHWETQVDRVGRRFVAAGMNVPMAQVFSARRNGVERFLTALQER